MKRAWILGVCSLFGCGNSVSECTNATMGAEGQFVAHALTAPMSSNDFAFDLNGDGHTDNRIGNIIGALIQNGLNVQDGINTSVMDGSVLLLIDEKASDLTNNDCAQVNIQKGMKPASPPKFDGSDMFTVDSSFGTGTVKGKISGGKFNSNNPATASTDYSLSVQFPLVTGEAPLSLTIHGAHVQFTKAGTGLMNGQVNGGIKSEDVQGSIIPTVAALLTNRLKNNTGGQNSTIQSLFDTGGTDDGSGCMLTANTCSGAQPAGTAACKNPTSYPATVSADVQARAGKCADQCDNIIDVCEVSTNSLVKNLLAPDVQLFTNGAYKPSADNKMKDSLSLGLGFTAVGAKF